MRRDIEVPRTVTTLERGVEYVCDRCAQKAVSPADKYGHDFNPEGWLVMAGPSVELHFCGKCASAAVAGARGR